MRKGREEWRSEGRLAGGSGGVEGGWQKGLEQMESLGCYATT